MKKTFFAIFLIFSANFIFAQDFYIERGDTIFLYPEKSARSGEKDGWLVTQHGNRVKIAEGVIVELKNGSNANFVFSKYEIKSFEKLSQNIFLVIPNAQNKQFELSRELLENDAVKNSHPNFVREIRAR
ncbi:MAG: hypothetical protein FWF51_00120 [Chitinivibrionia bacterium]|nr:hypothetical protein [Chitinivibrionia bacterium]